MNAAAVGYTPYRAAMVQKALRRQPAHDPSSLLDDGYWEGDEEKEAIDMKQVLSYNKDSYEKRVKDTYREQAMLRMINKQRLQTVRHRHLEQFRAQTEQRRQFEASVGSPWLWQKQRLVEEQERLAAALAHERPAFADLEALEPLYRIERMRRRGLSEKSNLPALISPRDLLTMHARRIEMPEIGSLMNPRNMMTSPMPDKRELLTSIGISPVEAPRLMNLPQILQALPALCDELKTDLGLARTNKRPRKPLPQLFIARMVHQFGLLAIGRMRLEQLRAACALHAATHPRVAIFQEAAQLVEVSRPWSDVKLQAYLTLYDSLTPWLGSGPAPGHSSPRERPEPPSTPRTSPRTPRSAASTSAAGSPRRPGLERGFTRGKQVLLDGQAGSDVRVLQQHEAQRGAEATSTLHPAFHRVSELPFDFVEVLLQRCVKLGLLPADSHALADAKALLRRRAHELELPQRMPPAPPREGAAVDADRLVVSWMEVWDRWEEDWGGDDGSVSATLADAAAADAAMEGRQ